MKSNKEENIDMNIEIDYELFEYLKKNTTLNLNDYMTVNKMREKARKLTNLHRKHEPSDSIGVDYSIAEQIEYELRMQTFERSMRKFWEKYKQGESLRDFCKRCLADEMKENLHKTK